jgi:hypothetical protein
MQSSPSHSPSPMSIGSMGLYYAAKVLCDTNRNHINLADLYHQQRQLTIHSTPPRTHPTTQMSSNASFNASNKSPLEAPIPLPPHISLTLTPLALSPCTIQTTLQTQPNLNTTLLRDIANGLLQTIANRETDTTISTKWYKDHICTLEQWVLHYEDTFNKPPTGYILNNGKISNFHIPIGGGLYQEAKWIHLNDNGMVSRYHSTQGPNEQPYTINLYAAADYSVNSPLKPLLPWFHHILTGPRGDLQLLQQTIADTDDWGLT